MNDNKSAYNSSIYDEHIINVLPYYREYHNQALDVVRAMGIELPVWLDTGCGTGTLAMRILETFPEAKLTLCDPSEKMLDIAKSKLSGNNVQFFNLSSEQLQFGNEFDVVTAIQCHHYLSLEGREKAVKACYKALKESGVFISFENIKMETDAADVIALKRWQTFLEEHGNSPEDVKMHIERRGVEVFPIAIREHIELLKKCGFRSVNVLWTSYLQAGFWAIK
ncbi:MAG: class I SAM-dependent methyltransferase [Saccharofermentans sp.]|nr:class I SAM-dependent methyltransferase [Saccharofermentans sp.]